MMSPFQLDPKLSGASSPSSSVVDFEATGKASAAPVDRKRSFATLLGNVKKEKPPETRWSSANQPTRASALSEKLQHAPVAAKAKGKDHARSTASPGSPARSKAEVPSEQENAVNPDDSLGDTGADRERVELPEKKEDDQVSDTSVLIAGLAPSPMEAIAPVALFMGAAAFSDSTQEQSESAVECMGASGATAKFEPGATPLDLMQAGAPGQTQLGESLAAAVSAKGSNLAATAKFEPGATPLDLMQAGAPGQTQLGESLAAAVSAKGSNLAATAKTGSLKDQKITAEAQAVSAKDKNDALEALTENAQTSAQGIAAKADSGELARAMKHTALASAAGEPVSGLLSGPSRAEKNAAALIAAVPSGNKTDGSDIFNNIENIGNNRLKKVDSVVGVSAAQGNPVMSSTLLNFAEASRTDAPASEAVARVNLVQVVDEVAAITEKMRVSGQHRCVVDFDVAGHGNLRVEVVRRDDQLKTVFSTDSEALRQSLQAALDRADRPGQMATSFEWQGASSDSSGRGQSGTQADADSRQNTYFKAESGSRTARGTSVAPVSTEPVTAPPLAAHHRLQLFA